VVVADRLAGRAALSPLPRAIWRLIMPGRHTANLAVPADGPQQAYRQRTRPAGRSHPLLADLSPRHRNGDEPGASDAGDRSATMTARWLVRPADPRRSARDRAAGGFEPARRV